MPILKSKQFKVIRLDEEAEEAGYFSHVMCGPDGECWKVLRKRDGLVDQVWQVGDTITVPTLLMAKDSGDRAVLPDWSALDCELPVQQTLRDARDVVRQVWGLSIARKHFGSGTGRRRMAVRLAYSCEHFVASPHRSAEEKALVANDFVRFAEGGFKLFQFSGRCYRALSVMFGLKPLDGHASFYDQWCVTARSRYQLIQRILDWVPVGQPNEGDSDLELTIQSYVIRNVLGKVVKGFLRDESYRERRMLCELLRKYGMPPQWRDRDPSIQQPK